MHTLKTQLKDNQSRHRGFLRGTFRSIDITLAAALAIVILLVGAAPSVAEHTRFWQQSDYGEFDKGTATGVALRSDGRLVLAPKFAPFADANLAYLWSLRMDSHGALFAAGGSNAKVVRFDGTGKVTTVFESTEVAAQTLVFDKSDNLYVGTSPDGKVYKVTPDGKQSVFFDPKTKYIWDLTFGPDGTLYVATGGAGKIFAVAPDGKNEVFYGGEETHIRALTLDGKGNLLAGTEPDGLVLRIPLAAPPTAASAARRGAAQPRADQKIGVTGTAGNTADNGRRAYVVYETSKKEITALVTDPAGNLYVSAIGEKTRATPAFTPAQPQAPPQSGGGNVTITVGGGNPEQPAVTAFAPFQPASSAAVYRIAADDSPEEIWSSRDSLVYAMGLSADGKLLLGTGNQGDVIQLDGDRVFSRLAKTESQQITGFARAPNGKVYLAAANPGKVFTLGPELESEGTFESQTFDGHIFSRWGRLTWWGENAAASGTSSPPSSNIELYVRCGNTSVPGDNWSTWFGPYRNPKGQEVECPAARFVQWRAVLHGGSGPAPDLSWVNLAYLPKNIAPQIDDVALQNPGVRVAGIGGQPQGGAGQPVPAQLRQPLTGTQGGFAIAPRPPAESVRFEQPPQGFVQKGYQGVLWSAEDANDDDLTYSIFYRGEGEKDWKLLKDKLDQKFYSWDTSSMPDGAYYLKIVASDERSNPHDDALSSERQSERFVVDNTPPEVAGIVAEPATPSAPGDPSEIVRFRASDATSAIVRTQYSLDAGDWTLTLPTDQLSDSPQESYAITLRGLTPGEHTVSVRVYDQFENEAAAKVTFTISVAAPRGR